MSTFNDESRTRLLLPLEMAVDPTGSAVQLKIDDTWHDCTWLGSPVQGTDDHGQPSWFQTARTIEFFAGPGAEPAGAVVLGMGRHPAESSVTFAAGDRVVKSAGSVNVVKK